MKKLISLIFAVLLLLLIAASVAQAEPPDKWGYASPIDYPRENKHHPWDELTCVPHPDPVNPNNLQSNALFLKSNDDGFIKQIGFIIKDVFVIDVNIFEYFNRLVNRNDKQSNKRTLIK